MTATDTPATETEAEAEATRNALVDTLNQLKDNLKPSNMVEEVMTNAKVGATAISDQVWDVARRNPLPALLIGAGAAMLLGLGQRASSRARQTPMSASQNPSAGLQNAEPLPRVSALASQNAQSASKSWDDAYGSVKTQANDLLTSANANLSHIASATSRRIHDTFETGGSMSYPGSRNQMMNSLSKMLEDQPLILAAVGVAVGAALGAAIPQTETENSLMGESSGSIRSAAQDMAQEQLAQLKSAAAHAVEDIKQTAAEHGVSAENLSGLVHDVADKTKAATYNAGRTLDPTAS